MPGKHVHFSDTNQLYSPGCSTPSLTWSPSSLPSSVGPYTPPRLAPSQLSPLPPVPVVINPVLGLNMDHRGYNAPPMLTWNLIDMHDSIVHSSSRKSLGGRTLDEPATHPPLQHIVLVHPQLPWPIHVRPSRSGYVSVADVVHSLYDCLRQNVSSYEFNSHPRNDKISLTYQARCKMAKGSRRYDDEKRKGVKRIDFLMERTRWVGLSSTKEGPNVWMLNTCPW